MSTNESKADEAVDFAPRRVTRSKGRPPDDIEINLEKLKVDELCHLKKSKAGHLGYLNRIYREIEDLMLDPCNLNQVKARKQTLDDAFNNCLQVHKKYIINLDDSREQHLAFQAYEDIIHDKEDFDNLYQRWIRQFGHSSGFDTREKSNKSGLETLSQTGVESITESINRLESKHEQLLGQRKLQHEISEMKNEQMRILAEINQREAEIEREMTLLERDLRPPQPTRSDY